MKKMRKGKKMLLIFLIAIVIGIVGFVVFKFVGNIQQEPETPQVEEEVIVPLPETTYSEMQVRNVQMEYLKENNETMISMEIDNTTDKVVEDEFLTVVWIGEDENVLEQMDTWIQRIAPGEQYKISVIEKGDLTSTKQIKLIEK